MFVNVKTEKRQQTLECHPSSLISAVQLNRGKTQILSVLSVAWEKTCFNSSKGGLDQRIFLQDCLIEHNSSNGGRQW